MAPIANTDDTVVRGPAGRFQKTIRRENRREKRTSAKNSNANNIENGVIVHG